MRVYLNDVHTAPIVISLRVITGETSNVSSSFSFCESAENPRNFFSTKDSSLFRDTSGFH